MIQKDSFVEIGASHDMCEDYAITGDIYGYSYGIVCDGCSSAQNTDLGAKILGIAAEQALRSSIVMFGHKTLSTALCSFENKVLGALSKVAIALCLDIQTFYATLMVVIANNEGFGIAVWGDGVVVFNDGFDRANDPNPWIRIEEISYTSNMPYYLAYRMEDEKIKDYMNTMDILGNPEKTVLSYNPDEDFKSSTIPMFEPYIMSSAPMAEGMSISLFTDGISSFENTSVLDNAIRMTVYKTFKGEFVKRRMKKIRIMDSKINNKHFDDIACATLLKDKP